MNHAPIWLPRLSVTTHPALWTATSADERTVQKCSPRRFIGPRSKQLAGDPSLIGIFRVPRFGWQRQYCMLVGIDFSSINYHGGGKIISVSPCRSHAISNDR